LRNFHQLKTPDNMPGFVSFNSTINIKGDGYPEKDETSAGN